MMIEAICHDFRSMINGTIRNISDSGCELISSVNSSDSVFPQKAQIMLNLFDPKAGKSVNIKARLTRAFRQEGTWVYKVRWDSGLVSDFIK